MKLKGTCYKYSTCTPGWIGIVSSAMRRKMINHEVEGYVLLVRVPPGGHNRKPAQMRTSPRNEPTVSGTIVRVTPLDPRHNYLERRVRPAPAQNYDVIVKHNRKTRI